MDHSNYQIIGGGVGGMCMALGLQKNHFSYTLHEKGSEITYDEVGLGISRNIFPILQEWEILEKVQEMGTEIRQMIFVNKKMKPLRSLRLKYPPLSVNRPRFYDVLSGEIQPENMKLNSSRTPKNFPERDVVIAADGMYSETRRRLFPQLRLRRSGQFLWRGIANISLDKSFHHSYFDFIGGNIRFAIIHTGGDQYSWYAISTEPFSGGIPEMGVKKHLNYLLEGYSPIAKEVVAHTEKVYSCELADMDPAERKGIKWFSGNVVLIGDAIHPTTPNMANGACLAMEDAYVLSLLFKRWGKETEKAFTAFQKLREKKVNSIVHRSWALGQLMHKKDKLMDAIMQTSTRLTPQWAFDVIYSGVLNDESLRRARGMWKI